MTRRQPTRRHRFSGWFLSRLLACFLTGLYTWLIARGRGKTCGPACTREARRRVLTANHPKNKADFRERRRAQARQKILDSPEFRAVADALRQLDPAVLAAVPPRDREVLTRYYGVVSQPPETQEEIARSLGLSRRRIGMILKRQRERLVGRSP